MVIICVEMQFAAINVLLPVVGCGLGLLALCFGLRAGKRQRLVDGLPTSKTTGVFIGLTEIKGTAEAWESGALGRDAAHATRVPAELEQQIDDALDLQMISIRLPKELIEDFKMIAQYHKLGYQPLMRDALKRFATAEMKKIAVQAFKERMAKEHANNQVA